MEKKNINKKNIVRIGVPLMVLCGILAVIVITQKPIEKISSELKIRPFDFYSYVNQYIEDSISGKSKAQALRGYERIYDIISTEASIVATQDTRIEPLLNSGETDDCFEQAFKAYFPIFEHDADHLFAGSVWNDLGRFEKEASDLAQRRGISAAESEKLKKYLGYVYGYAEARRLIAASGSCKDASSYDYYCNRADKYKGEPYVNNSILKNIASDVRKRAKYGWQTAITNYVNDVCAKSCSNYNSYEDFHDNYYKPAFNQINEYEKKFNTSWGVELTKKLEEKDTSVDNYFNPSRY